MSISEHELDRAADILRRGGLVALPTETVYGLGANALDPQAVARVFEVKGRPRFDPLIVHVPDSPAARQYVTRFPPLAEKLADRFWPGPLTMVLPKREMIPDIVTSGLPGVGLRVPDHPVAQSLLRRAGCPIAAPSANLFGRISPTTAQHVRDQLGEQIDLILDGGPCRVGVESTVVMIHENDQVQLLRPGGVTIEELQEVIGTQLDVHIFSNSPHEHRSSQNQISPDTADGTSQLAPGMLSQHYAPRTPLVIWEGHWPADLDQMVQELTTRGVRWGNPADNECLSGLAKPRVGLLTMGGAACSPGWLTQVEELAAEGDLRTAAAGFFAALRRLDAAGLDVILATPFPSRGLGLALNDRLQRAARR